jgi:hypothetical protein
MGEWFRSPPSFKNQIFFSLHFLDRRRDEETHHDTVRPSERHQKACTSKSRRSRRSRRRRRRRRRRSRS